MTGSKILMIDDSVAALAFGAVMLRNEGYRLTTAENAKLALEVARRAPPDLILLDVVMPGMDGIECCRRLKADPATKNIPVIMVTARGAETMVVAAYAAGCDDFITKPIDRAELLHKIRGHLAWRAGAGAAP